MVALTVTPFKVATLSCRRTSPHNGFDHCGSVFYERFFFKGKFPDWDRNVAILVELEFYAARFHLLHSFRQCHRSRSRSLD